MDKTAQKTEAIRRMKALKMHQNTIDEFRDKDKLNVSTMNKGILYWINKEQEAYVKAFEEEYGALVYHVIHDHTSIGELLTMLYVSQDEETWKEDMEYLQNEGFAYAYVKNLDDNWCSEIGGVWVEAINGGVRRIA